MTKITWDAQGRRTVDGALGEEHQPKAIRLLLTEDEIRLIINALESRGWRGNDDLADKLREAVRLSKIPLGE